MRIVILLIALVIQPLQGASDGTSPTGLNASIEARSDRIVIDGVQDSEWERHAIVGMESSSDGISVNWRAAWDNALIYFIFDIDLGSHAPGTGITPTIKIFHADRTHVFSIPIGSGHTLQNDTIFYYASGNPGSRVIVEAAIDQPSIGQPAKAFDDFSELQPIALEVGVSIAAEHGTLAASWPGNPGESDLPPNEWGAVGFMGLPGDMEAFDFEPSRDVLPPIGGTVVINQSKFHPDAWVDFLIVGLPSQSGVSWLTAEMSGPSVIVTALPNEGLNRSGIIRFGDYGNIRIDQHGNAGGNPWFYDEDFLQISEWFGPFIDAHFPWIHHAVLGWLYVEGSNTESLNLYDNLTGLWFWTSEDAYPHIYLWGPEQGWYYLVPQSFSDGRWCWSFIDNQWNLIREMEADPAN